MAAPEGNQFWRQRSKHGRGKIFSSSEILWEAACEYFEWCDNNPLLKDTVIKLKVNGSGEILKHEPLAKMRAYTLKGLCLFLGVHEDYFYEFKIGVNVKDDSTSKELYNTVLMIEKVIYTQKFTGAAAGLLNPSIIARELGLSDKADVKIKVGKDFEGAIVDWSGRGGTGQDEVYE